MLPEVLYGKPSATKYLLHKIFAYFHPSYIADTVWNEFPSYPRDSKKLYPSVLIKFSLVLTVDNGK